MERFYGMMPRDKVRVTRRFKTELGLIVTIQAGTEGWTIIYPDKKCMWKDKFSTTSENYNEAKETLFSQYSNLTDLDGPVLTKTEYRKQHYIEEDDELDEDIDYGDEDADYESEDELNAEDIDYGNEDE